MADAISWPRYASRLLATYLLRGERGVSELADSLESTAHEQPGGKFSKRDVRYLPVRPFPLVLWHNTCGRCQFWEEGGPGEPAHCHVVGREGDPYGGEAIHHNAWCGLYTPPDGEPALAWVRDRIRPDGSTDVRGKYDPPLARKTKTRQLERRLREREERPREAAPGGEASDGRGDAPTGDDRA